MDCKIRKIYLVEKENENVLGLMVELPHERILVYRNKFDQLLRLPISVVSNR